ncbi:MAG TPA: SCO family protein [Longimicrobium sp.]|nr:SCO family protein [Longimicrobium sp.]
MRAPLRLPLLAASAAFVLAAACGRALARVDPSVAGAPAAAAEFSVYDLEAGWRDQDGRARVLGSLRGKTRVVAMVYTSCAHTCPMIVAEMKRLEAALPPAEQGSVGFVLVSLDPARDTPARMKSFATAMRLDPAAWTLLTGGADEVRELAAVLGIRYRAEADGQISHANTYVVLDPAGGIVHRQDGLGGGTDAVLARIRRSATTVAD